MDKLFEPLRLGTKTAKNRIVFAATGTGTPITTVRFRTRPLPLFRPRQRGSRFDHHRHGFVIPLLEQGRSWLMTGELYGRPP